MWFAYEKKKKQTDKNKRKKEKKQESHLRKKFLCEILLLYNRKITFEIQHSFTL